MSDDDDDRRILEEVAKRADAEAKNHDEECYIGKAFRSISKRAREMATESGPPQVATPAFRKNWETIFGKKQVVGEA